MTTGRRVGDLGPQAVVGSFDFHWADLDENDQIHGLGQRAIWPYGGYRTDSGKLYVLERKYVHQMSGGVWAMSDEGGALNLLPQAVHTARGELRREITPDKRIYRDHLMAKMGDLAPKEELPLYMELTDNEMIWQEGELLDLRGTGIGPGLSLFVLEREWPFSYIGRAMYTTGTILGEPVKGVTWIDHGYWANRGEWKEVPFYSERQIAWNVFWTEFADGSHEWGHIVRGINGMGACMVANQDGPVVTTGHFDAEFTLDDDNYVSSARYTVGDIGWEFTGNAAGQMPQFSTARWGEYRAQGGAMRRIGETREIVNGFTWLECFADRMRAEGLAKN